MLYLKTRLVFKTRLTYKSCTSTSVIRKVLVNNKLKEWESFAFCNKRGAVSCITIMKHRELRVWSGTEEVFSTRLVRACIMLRHSNIVILITKFNISGIMVTGSGLRPVHTGTNIGARYSPAFFNAFVVFTPKRFSLTMSRVNMQIHSLTLDGA